MLLVIISFQSDLELLDIPFCIWSDGIVCDVTFRDDCGTNPPTVYRSLDFYDDGEMHSCRKSK